MRPIAGDLQDCLDITANLLTVAGRYLDEGELGELTDSRAALAESGGITEAHAAYERLLGDAETVFLKLEDCSPERTGRGLREGVPHRPGRPSRTPSPGTATTPPPTRYNERVLGGFPARVLGTLTFVRPAETFR